MISGNDGRNFYRAAALCSILLLLIILIGYYLRIPRLGGWFSNDDFLFLSNYRRTLSFGAHPLADSFFRPISRNFFWWLFGGVCATSYKCYFFTNLIILASGIAVFFAALFRAFLPEVNSRASLVALTACALTFALLMPSSISLASWISNTQATIALLLFSIIFYVDNRAPDGAHWYSQSRVLVWVVFLALAFSNIGYFVAAAAYLILSRISSFARHRSRSSFIDLAMALGTAIAVLYVYKKIILRSLLPNTPYCTQWTLDTIKSNIQFYLSVDRVAMLLIGVVSALTAVVWLINASRSRSGKAPFGDPFMSDIRKGGSGKPSPSTRQWACNRRPGLG